jgi:transcriptional regulator with XRE-family HTH domain
MARKAKKQAQQAQCDVRTSFATAFSNWRQRNKIPLKKVAADLGLSIATISKWELGQRFPTGRHFEMLVIYTGEPPCRLFCVMAAECVPPACTLVRPSRK